MPENPPCEQCGGREYVVESGFYFCAECHVQSQDIREQVFDEFAIGVKSISTRAPLSQTGLRTPSSSPMEGLEATSWEVLNLILKGLVDQLIRLGARRELKVAALQMWASYLKKSEAAFFSKSVQKRPRLGVFFRKKDARLIYGANKEVIDALKHPVAKGKRKRAISTRGSSKSSATSARSEKIRLTLKKKALAKAEYENLSESSQTSGLTLDSVGRSSKSSQKSLRVKHSKKAKKSLEELMEKAKNIPEDGRHKLQNSLKRAEGSCVLATIFSLLRLSLLHIDSPILLSDLMRWDYEGYLSFRKAEKLLPSSIKAGEDLKTLFINSFSSVRLSSINCKRLAKFIGFERADGDVLKICDRYLEELRLPGELLSIVENTLKLRGFPVKKRYSHVSRCYESDAMALIIIALKLALSLDGISEFSVSRLTSGLNNDRDENEKLFNWSEWVSYINCSSAALAHECQVMRDVHFPRSRVGGPQPFTSQWDYNPSKQVLTRAYRVNSNLAANLRRVVDRFGCRCEEPLPPTLRPLTKKLESVLKRRKFTRLSQILGLELEKRKILWLGSDSKSLQVILEKDEEAQLTGFEVDERIPFMLVRPPKLSWQWSGDLEVRIKDRKIEKLNISLEETFEFSEITATPLQRNLDASNKGPPSFSRSIPYWSLNYGTFLRSSYLKCEKSFNESFSPSFLWLLRECSKIIYTSPKDLYKKVLFYEKFYFKCGLDRSQSLM